MNLTKPLRKKRIKSVTLDMILDVYDAFLREYEITKIAAALNTTAGTLCEWIDKFPDLQRARDLATERRGQAKTFKDYIFQRLSPEAKKIWEALQFWEDSETTTREKVDAILSGRPTRLRQEIFLHALISNSFNLSEACRIACVSRATVEVWKREDLEFLQMVEEIQWHKKNFAEGALMDLVAQRNPGAVLFVNRTLNADRGYTEKLELQHTGSIDAGLNIDELDLDVETRLKILEAIRKKRTEKRATVIEVENDRGNETKGLTEGDKPNA